MLSGVHETFLPYAGMLSGVPETFLPYAGDFLVFPKPSCRTQGACYRRRNLLAGCRKVSRGDAATRREKKKMLSSEPALMEGFYAPRIVVESPE
jgi:hypothetical protein